MLIESTYPINTKHIKMAEKQQNTNISDLNADCIASILKYLDFASIINAAVSNKRLQMGAEIAFKEKKYKIISIIPSPSQNTYAAGNKLVIGGIKSCLQFISCFGFMVKVMDIQYSTPVWHLNNNLVTILDNYVQSYCIESLKDIMFYGRKSMEFRMTKVFPTVESVQIQLCNIDRQLPWFVEHFPNTSRVVLLSNRLDREFCHVEFPMLQHLTLKINTDSTSRDFSVSIASIFVQSNAILKSLDIHSEFQIKISLDNLMHIIGGTSIIN